ncbi:hypothetical protein ACFOY8_17630 [Thalassospira xianhensis]|uniref:Uncharacterized protein n=1 Tax=Thalassospira xianhensis MCCC 1A02616 TaxID=1177929 RepID=A0A367UGC8_9PROT|nr:hypothetical protein [Thalassospira xianhensis]RCK07366.1 hypothetical protein TH5_02970 [Thalassospira xianhensis MCCC 1A02616]
MGKSFPFNTEMISEWIWKIEKDLRLLEKEDDGVYYWRLIRFPLWLALHEKSGLMSELHPRRSLTNRFQILLRLPKAITKYNPFFVRRQIKSIILPHSRLIDGVEIHSYPVMKNLKSREYLLLYQGWYGEQLAESKNLIFPLILDAIKRRSLHQRIRLNSDTQSLMAEAEIALLETFGFRVDLCKLAINHIGIFQRSRRIYHRLFRCLQAQELYVVVGYTTAHMAAIDAAHACGMRTAEIQHGSYTVYQPAYGFPNYLKDVPYSPKYFLSLGDFWVRSASLPRNTKPKVIGADVLHRYIQNYLNKTKIPKSILFISQGTVALKLCQIAIECAKMVPCYSITYRLHPREALEKYKSLFPADTLPENFRFSCDEVSTLAMLSEAEIVAGVYSTSLYEGMLLGCRTLLLNLPGIEHMKAVLERGDALMVDDAESFCAHLKNAPKCQSPYDYYAVPKEISWD